MLGRDISEVLQQKVRDAVDNETPLKIEGGSSKSLLGRETHGEVLSVSAHCGIVEYDPRELVITARSGTPLKEVEAVLSEAGQILAFEPPHFGDYATLGGTIACGISGPCRPFLGSVRDSILGCKLINGRAEMVCFGGQVIKNVAGYDVSRLMVGAYGTLGVLLDVSLKVLPRPAVTKTLIQECTQVESIRKASALLSRSLPVSAACYHGGRYYLRLSGSETAVQYAQECLGGDVMEQPELFWHALREHCLPFFKSTNLLYRVVVQPATPPLEIAGEWLLDWGGAQRWLISNESIISIRERVTKVGGHVTQFRGGERSGEIFQPLTATMRSIHERLKAGFDPNQIFNQGRMYASL